MRYILVVTNPGGDIDGSAEKRSEAHASHHADAPVLRQRGRRRHHPHGRDGDRARRRQLAPGRRLFRHAEDLCAGPQHPALDQRRAHGSCSSCWSGSRSSARCWTASSPPGRAGSCRGSRPSAAWSCRHSSISRSPGVEPASAQRLGDPDRDRHRLRARRARDPRLAGAGLAQDLPDRARDPRRSRRDHRSSRCSTRASSRCRCSAARPCA